MTITFTKQKEVQESIEVPTPYYLYNELYQSHSCINDDGSLVIVYGSMITLYERKDNKAYTDSLHAELNKAKACSKEEFEEAFNNTFSLLKQSIKVAQKPVTA